MCKLNNGLGNAYLYAYNLFIMLVIVANDVSKHF